MKTYALRDWLYWYDRASRCWWAAQHDAEGNQIGEALNAATRPLIITYIEMEEADAS